MLVLDIERYVPFLLNAVSSAWQRKTSAIYRETFGFGIAEWRIIAMLAIEPYITGHRVCEVLRMDKAAVSRTLSGLVARGLVAFDAPESDPRRRNWRLSGDGWAAHEKLLAIALDHEAQMVEQVSTKDYETFLSVMHQMLANLDGRDIR